MRCVETAPCGTRPGQVMGDRRLPEGRAPTPPWEALSSTYLPLLSEKPLAHHTNTPSGKGQLKDCSGLGPWCVLEQLECLSPGR